MTVLVEIVVLEGAFPSSVAVTCDVLSTANSLRERSGRAPAFALRAVGSGSRQARAFIGGCDAPGRADIVVVPGLGLTGESEIADRLARRDAVFAGRAIASAAGEGASVAAGCSGVFLLAAAGLLVGRRATTTWWLAPLFRRLHPETLLDAEALLVTDGPITTAGAAMAQLDLVLALVARHAGPGLADACARYLLLDRRRSQSPYMALGLLAAADDRVAAAERWARARLGERFAVADLSAAVNLAPRTFARRVRKATGLSPVQFLQRIRVERAVELIETSRASFEEIARQVGYADPSTLRRAMNRQAGGGARKLRRC